MNYWDGQQWTPSDPRFTISPEGDAFVAERVQHRTRLAANINTPGAVTVSMPDGTGLRSTPVAIGLFNAVSGESVILAGIRDCVGALMSENQVVYEGAFNVNGVTADIVYTIEKGSFAQDIVITGRLDPMDYGFSTNGARLQLYTELYDVPEPERVRQPIRVEQDKRLRDRMVSPDLVDEMLGFGEFVIATGRARMAGTPRASGESAAPVVKEIVNREGRTFLLESVEFASVETELKSLPDRWVGALNRNRTRLEARYAAMPAPNAQNHVRLMASMAPDSARAASVYKPMGLAIDYFATLGGTISGVKIFEGDTTFFVAGPVYCTGTVYFEGGAIFKYPYSIGGGSPTTAFIRLASSVYCSASGYSPTLFTSGDDDSIGEIIDYDVWNGVTGSTEGKHYANPALWLYYNYFPSISNMRFSFCQEGVRSENNFQTSGTTISHSQFVNCIRGIVLTGAGSGSGSSGGVPLTVNNALMAGVHYPVTANASASGNVLRHCTVDNSVRLVTANSSSSFTFLNSVFANVTNLVSGPASLSGSYNGFSPTTASLFGSVGTRWTTAYPPFQTAGLGGHYLKSDSVFRSKGTTGVGSALLNAFKSKSTQPPIDFPRLMTISGELALFPQGPRDVSGAPDLGYWYDVIDYTVALMRVDGGSITVMPGTAIGVRQEWVPEWGEYADYTYVGFELWEGSSFVSHGFPERPNTFVPTRLVQETTDPDFGLWRVFWLSQQVPMQVVDTYTFAPSFEPNSFGAPPPSLDLRFSNLYAHQLAFHLFSGISGFEALAWEGSFDSCMDWKMRDCNLSGGGIIVGPPTLTVNPDEVWGDGSIEWVNNLFDRVAVVLQPTYWSDGHAMNVDLAFTAYNNLFRNQDFLLDPIPATAGDWLFKDNLFDKAGFEFFGQESLDHGYNAYWQRVGLELKPGQTDRLQPASGNDVILTAALPYQSGPFGSHYLATYCPLYNSAKRGSRPPADAGLFHYTTRTDQTKDGSQSGNVIIGRHYVAAVNSYTAQPKGTDSDGISDYVEDANGNGQWDQDLETRVDAVYTTAGIHDSLNVAYDDVDLDGDGLVGRAEKILGVNPLLLDNPLMLVENTPAGANVRAYEFAASVPDEGLSRLSLYLDGEDRDMLCVTRVDEDIFRGEWNTLASSPGFHLLQLILDPPADISDANETKSYRVCGPPLAVHNTAPIWYDYTSQLFGSQLRIAGYAPAAYGNYQIKIRTAGGLLVKTINGTTDASGNFEKIWNLVPDGQSQPLADEVFQAEFIVAFVTPSISVPLPDFMRGKVPDTHGDDKFTLAYGWHTTGYDTQRRTMIQEGVTDLIFNPALANEYLNTSLNSWHGTTFFLYTPSDGQTLLNDMPLANNFFFFGHGNRGYFGSVKNDSHTGVLGALDSGDVATALENWWTPVGWKKLEHPYRFVVLNSCFSFDPAMCRAFGIQSEENALFEFFDKDGRRPQAFVGWKDDFKVPWIGYWSQYELSLATLYGNWMSNVELHTCLERAANVSVSYPYFRISKRYGIYGWPNLRRDGDNE